MIKTKGNLKLLLILGVTLLAIFVLGTSKVEASVATGIIEQGEITSNSLDNIPSTISVDLKESECEKTPKAILNQIIEELKKQNITVKDTSDLWNEDFTQIEPKSYIRLWVSLEDINKVSISVTNIKDKEDNTNWEEILDREITITYSNSSKYNEKDKKYVESLISNITNNSGEYSYTIYSDIEGKASDYKPTKSLEEAINDKTMELISFGGSGTGPDPFHTGGEGIYKMFKDGIYYNDIGYAHWYNKQVIIPNNIEDTDSAYINYALPKKNEYLNNWYKEFDSEYNFKPLEKLEKISGCYYKIAYDTTTHYDVIVLRKEVGTPVGNNIFVDNLPQNATVKATVKSNATMETELKNKGYSNILGSYELKLEGATKLISPIDVTFNVGTEHNNKTVYILHQKQNGSYENFEEKVVNGKITVTVSELSPFVLGLKEDTDTDVGISNTEKPSTTTPTTKPEHKLDDTPKTGNSGVISYISLVIVISLAGIIVLRKFNN